ncbi:hypothetical protein DBR42_03260 [Pelomonas sp. HMWF004]|nr:hypothetical protein DBR42_03260 [Pelomonas sp. HMWF004]
MEAALTRQVAAGASAQTIAAIACAAWQRVDDALSPIVGRQGVAALFKRSLHLAQAKHPKLAAVATADTSPGDFSALHAVLASQSGADAAALNTAVLTAFRDLLYSLIGAALTEQLLTPVWAPSYTDAPAQDHPT